MAFNILVLLFSTLSLAFGVFVFRYPQKTIKIQQQFYAMINWRMEPISMEKEIRNTKIMGGALVLFVAIVLISICLLSKV